MAPINRQAVDKIRPDNWHEFTRVNRAGRLTGEINKLEPIEDALFMAWIDQPSDNHSWADFENVERLIDGKYQALRECK